MSKHLSGKHYQENKEKDYKKAREKYQSLCKQEKQKKQQYGREQYKKLLEDQKANVC